jgi:DNA mismatch repair protein MutS2
MDAHALKVLEYSKIRERLAACCACSLGKRRAMALRPSDDPDWIRERLKETTEAREAIAHQGVPPFGGLTDVGELVTKARTGSSLEGAELRHLADALRAARRMMGYLDHLGELDYPRLMTLAARLQANEQLEERIERAIDDEGAVRDDASDELRSLWRRHGALHDRLQSILHAVLSREGEGHALQERLIVQRGGRYCVPIKAPAQSQFRGLIHDRSDSGVTVFMEPVEAVGPGNELREVELAIEQEKLRLLQELSGEVSAFGDAIDEDLRTLGVLDFIFAKATLAGKMSAAEPLIAERGTLLLTRARHPLLSGEVVPIDVWLGREFDTLVMTGPNTGGKTVALRTVGLLALMCQSGLHISADIGSEIGVFEEVFADIGDEQSIEQSLSTFSSHMTQIIRVLQKLEAWDRRDPGRVNALVLLDEIGAGTDPTEGSALARATLEELQRLGARTIVTTHYNELKTFAYATPRVENASVEFDVKTLRPTYRLLIGQAGSSNAFEIAQRLGLPRVIARRAQSLLGEEETQVAEIMRRMERAQQRLHTEAGLAAEERAALEEIQREYAAQLADLNARRRAALDGGFAEARQIVERAEVQARAIIADLQRQPTQSKITEQRRREIARLRAEIEEAEREQAEEEAPPPAPLPEGEGGGEEGEPAFTCQPGDPVHVQSLARDGIVLRFADQHHALVEMGKMRVEVPVTDLAPPVQPIGEEHRRLAEKMELIKSMSVPPEINLIGTTVDEATEELDKYLDDAFLARLPSVRIIHGKGTGALRRGIHAYLKQNRHVRSFTLAERSEGGEGATIVQL